MNFFWKGFKWNFTQISHQTLYNQLKKVNEINFPQSMRWYIKMCVGFSFYFIFPFFYNHVNTGVVIYIIKFFDKLWKRNKTKSSYHCFGVIENFVQPWNWVFTKICVFIFSVFNFEVLFVDLMMQYCLFRLILQPIKNNVN